MEMSECEKKGGTSTLIRLQMTNVMRVGLKYQNMSNCTVSKNTATVTTLPLRDGRQVGRDTLCWRHYLKNF